MPFEFQLPSLEEMRSTSDGLEMLRMIDDDNFRSALVTGCPGSGKTTVSVYRLVRLSSQNYRIHLVTYQNMLVLAIQNLAEIQAVSPDRVSTFHKWYCPLADSGFSSDQPPTATEIISRLTNSGLAGQQLTEILVDEGQDLPISVYQALPGHFTRFFVSADDGQQVHRDHGARVEDIEGTLHANASPYKRFSLGRNFRNTYETYAFARQFVPRTNQVAWNGAILDRLRRSNRCGPKPVVITYSNESQRNAHLKTTLQNAEGNVAVLCPLGPLPRGRSHSGESVEEVYRLITEMGISATKYHHQTPVPDRLERYVVTTFRSAKGLEFDVVVIPRVNFFKPINEEWYVACTRARRQLFVYRDLSHPQVDPVSSFDDSTYEEEPLDGFGIVRTPQIPF